jgi:hypothetical protein
MKDTTSFKPDAERNEDNIFLNTTAKNFSNKEKIHNISLTSIESFVQLNKTNQRILEKTKVYEAIKSNGPVTSRKLSYLTGIERTNVCRSLYDMLREIQPAIKEAFTAKCETTGRKVKYYSVVDFQKNGNNG